MTTHTSGKKQHYFFIVVPILLLFTISMSFAQQIPPEVAQHGYAQTIFINGKIISMDDKSISTEVGNVYQALAVQGDRIAKLGTNVAVRALAGPDTQILDLKGRVLMPGIIESHQHIYGGAVRQLRSPGLR